MTESGGAIGLLKAALETKKKTDAVFAMYMTPLKQAQKEEEEHRQISQRQLGQNYLTARWLAALFQGLWPDTPNLIRAYRDRDSEIYRLASDVTPKSHLPESIFAPLVGLDGLSLSLSTTLTPPEGFQRGVIYVHLLACILANEWSWSELVEQRRQQIISDVKKGLESPFSAAAAAAKQDISWHHLVFWDRSARAWLQMAKVAMMKERGQVERILENVELTVGKSFFSYHSVIPAWLSALAAMENLVLGRPQETQDDDILRVILAWHLYPDLCRMSVMDLILVTGV